MNIETLLELEKTNSYKILRAKAGKYGEDFIEDAYCDARLKAIKSFHKFEKDKPFSKWWYRILINALIDKIKKHKVEIPLDNVDKRTYEISQSVHDAEALHDILNSISSLPNAQRQAIIDKVRSEMGFKTVSKKSQSSQRLALYKARKKIQKLFETTI
jgi:RNA polymerase sigma factor (sigma-70 family)